MLGKIILRQGNLSKMDLIGWLTCQLNMCVFRSQADGVVEAFKRAVTQGRKLQHRHIILTLTFTSLTVVLQNSSQGGGIYFRIIGLKRSSSYSRRLTQEANA